MRLRKSVRGDFLAVRLPRNCHCQNGQSRKAKSNRLNSQIPGRGTNRINSTSDLTGLTREWRSSERRRVVAFLNPAGKWKCFAARFTFGSSRRTAGSPILYPPVNSSLVHPASTGGLCNDRHAPYIPVTHTIPMTFAQVTREEPETFFIPCSSSSSSSSPHPH